VANLTEVADFGEFGDKLLCSANFSFSKEFPYLKVTAKFCMENVPTLSAKVATYF